MKKKKTSKKEVKVQKSTCPIKNKIIYYLFPVSTALTV